MRDLDLNEGENVEKAEQLLEELAQHYNEDPAEMLTTVSFLCAKIFLRNKHLNNDIGGLLDTLVKGIITAIDTDGKRT